MCADTRVGTTLLVCMLLQIYLYLERFRIAMATPATNYRGFMLKPKKTHTLRAFLSSSFLFSPIREIASEQMGLQQPYRGLFVHQEPFVPCFHKAEQMQLLLESVGISGVCFPVTWISRILAMRSPSPVALFSPRISWCGEVYNCQSCTALWKDSPLLQPEKLWCVFCVPELWVPGR